MMPSAFDSLSPSLAETVRAKFLAGAKMIDIRKNTGIAAKKLRECRDEVFLPLLTDPEAVKALANGPMLNASSMTKLPYARSLLTRMRQKANAERLTDSDKAAIQRAYTVDRYSAATIARRHDIHPNTVRSICKGCQTPNESTRHGRG